MAEGFVFTPHRLIKSDKKSQPASRSLLLYIMLRASRCRSRSGSSEVSALMRNWPTAAAARLVTTPQESRPQPIQHLSTVEHRANGCQQRFSVIRVKVDSVPLDSRAWSPRRAKSHVYRWKSSIRRCSTTAPRQWRARSHFQPQANETSSFASQALSLTSLMVCERYRMRAPPLRHPHRHAGTSDSSLARGTTRRLLSQRCPKPGVRGKITGRLGGSKEKYDGQARSQAQIRSYAWRFERRF